MKISSDDGIEKKDLKVYCKNMMLTLAIHCLLANILLGAATARYSFKCNGMPGVFYALLTLGGECVLDTYRASHRIVFAFYGKLVQSCHFFYMGVCPFSALGDLVPE